MVAEAADGPRLVRVKVRDQESNEQTIEGRVVVEAQDGGLIVELRNGEYRTIRSTDLIEKSPQAEPFRLMSADELGQNLVQTLGSGFEIHTTDHYVICANSAEEYAEFCGKLLERVYDQYFAFMKSIEVTVTEPTGPLPVIIFASESEFRDFAESQNPGAVAKDSPGCYSITHNQTLLMDLTRDRSVRSVSEIRKQLANQPLQVATMVHEAVHQLAFNSGLQVRLADNPIWVSEGLAVYFEPITPRSATLWTKPGSVNGRLHPIFMQSLIDGVPTIPLSGLIESDSTFRDSKTIAASYAESWGLVSYLFRHEKIGMKTYLTRLSQRKPLKPLSPEERRTEFSEAFGKAPDELQSQVVNYVKRLRVP